MSLRREYRLVEGRLSIACSYGRFVLRLLDYSWSEKAGYFVYSMDPAGDGNKLLVLKIAEGLQRLLELNVHGEFASYIKCPADRRLPLSWCH